MRRIAAAAIVACALLPLALLSLPPSVHSASPALTPKPHPASIPVIYTAAPVYASLAALREGERFPQGAQLMLLRNGVAQPLVPGFSATADASVSFDAKTVLFAGKRNAGDPWQLWTLPLDGGTPLLVRSAPTDLIRPLWMPGGRIVYARRDPGTRDAGKFVLETAALDGSPALRLSYSPGSFLPDDVLRDGRVLFESSYPLGTGASPEMYLVYADGSGVESVRCDHGHARDHGRQLLTGDIVFTHGSRLARFTSALADEAPIAAPPGEYAGDIAELPDGRWLLAMRVPGQQRYSLRSWNSASGALTILAQDPARDLVQPVVVAPRVLPNRHPSALHDWTTGNLLALDARQSRAGALTTTPAAVRVETIDEAGNSIVLGTAPVAADGSFLVQAAADRPLRFVLLDAQGNTLRQEHGWFWIRHGEQRICVGCHTGPERAPENRVPAVLLHSTTPADATGRALPAALRAALGAVYGGR